MSIDVENGKQELKYRIGLPSSINHLVESSLKFDACSITWSEAGKWYPSRKKPCKGSKSIVKITVQVGDCKIKELDYNDDFPIPYLAHRSEIWLPFHEGTALLWRWSFLPLPTIEICISCTIKIQLCNKLEEDRHRPGCPIAQDTAQPHTQSRQNTPWTDWRSVPFSWFASARWRSARKKWSQSI